MSLEEFEALLEYIEKSGIAFYKKSKTSSRVQVVIHPHRERAKSIERVLKIANYFKEVIEGKPFIDAAGNIVFNLIAPYKRR